MQRLVASLSVSTLAALSVAAPAWGDEVAPPQPVLSSPPVQVADPPVPSLDALLAIAKAAMAAKNEYLVTGAVRALPASYAGWFASEQPTLDDRRAALAATWTAYTSHVEYFDSATLATNGATASVVAEVGTRFGMSGTEGVTGVPPYSSGEEELHFEFALSATGWTLGRLDTNDAGGAYYGGGDATEADPLVLTHPPATQPVVDDVTLGAVDTHVGGSIGVGIQTPPDDTSNRHYADRARVVAYAIAHSGDPRTSHRYNSDYVALRNDCTNFVSQALEYGGWPMTPRYNGDPVKEWWYESGKFATSWTAAQHLYWFVDDNHWAPKRVTLSAFRPGDLMQARFGNYHPDEIGHSMIVTGRNSKGALFVTYHTANWENTPYADFVKRAKTSVTPYGWNVG